jgi:hypothetical protein
MLSAGVATVTVLQKPEDAGVSQGSAAATPTLAANSRNASEFSRHIRSVRPQRAEILLGFHVVADAAILVDLAHPAIRLVRARGRAAIRVHPIDADIPPV